MKTPEAMATAFRDEFSVVLIQAAVRGFLVREQTRRIRKVVKLQSSMRGYLVRRQAAATLRCVQAIVKMQTLVRRRRNGSDHRLGRQSSIQTLLKNGFCRLLLESTPKTKPIYISCERLRSESEWKWLERWMAASNPHGERIEDSQVDQTVEKDSESPALVHGKNQNPSFAAAKSKFEQLSTTTHSTTSRRPTKGLIQRSAAAYEAVQTASSSSTVKVKEVAEKSGDVSSVIKNGGNINSSSSSTSAVKVTEGALEKSGDVSRVTQNGGNNSSSSSSSSAVKVTEVAVESGDVSITTQNGGNNSSSSSSTVKAPEALEKSGDVNGGNCNPSSSSSEVKVTEVAEKSEDPSIVTQNGGNSYTEDVVGEPHEYAADSCTSPVDQAEAPQKQEETVGLEMAEQALVAINPVTSDANADHLESATSPTEIIIRSSSQTYPGSNIAKTESSELHDRLSTATTTKTDNNLTVIKKQNQNVTRKKNPPPCHKKQYSTGAANCTPESDGGVDHGRGVRRQNSLPRYMQATQSTKAKLLANNNNLCRENLTRKPGSRGRSSSSSPSSPRLKKASSFFQRGSRNTIAP